MNLMNFMSLKQKTYKFTTSILHSSTINFFAIPNNTQPFLLLIGKG